MKVISDKTIVESPQGEDLHYNLFVEQCKYFKEHNASYNTNPESFIGKD